MMERRTVLKAIAGFAAFAAMAGSAAAAPLAVDQLAVKARTPDEELPEGIERAVANEKDIDAARVEEVRWGRRRGWGFRRRSWGRRHWGWRRRRMVWRPRRRRWWRRRRVRYYW